MSVESDIPVEDADFDDGERSIRFISMAGLLSLPLLILFVHLLVIYHS